MNNVKRGPWRRKPVHQDWPIVNGRMIYGEPPPSGEPVENDLRKFPDGKLPPQQYAAMFCRLNNLKL